MALWQLLNTQHRINIYQRSNELVLLIIRQANDRDMTQTVGQITDLNYHVHLQKNH